MSKKEQKELVDLDKIVSFIKKRLLLEEKYFSSKDGVNEYIVIVRAWEIDSNESVLKNSIDDLIDKGEIKIVKTDEKNIRYLRLGKEVLPITS